MSLRENYRDAARFYGAATASEREAIPSPNGKAGEPHEARATPVASYRRESVEWLVRARVPKRAVTLLVGDPGLGKSLWTCALAGEVSRGGGDVLFLTAEDSIAATVRPRLEAVGADLDRVHVVTLKRDGIEEGLSLPDDVPELDRLVGEAGAQLVVIDPLMAHLPENVNSWRDQSVRRALAPLHHLAEAHGCAVVVIAHLNKIVGDRRALSHRRVDRHRGSCPLRAPLRSRSR